VRQAGLPADSTPGQEVVSSSLTSRTPAQQGQSLLEKARMELRRGETGTARRMAEEACSGPYGVRDQAVALLRSIDAEEFNQRRLLANRTFDAARSAWLRHDYAIAGNMLAGIDPKLLDPARQSRLREILMTPEMQPSAR
jgi:hypothetical protein